MIPYHYSDDEVRILNEIEAAEAAKAAAKAAARAVVKKNNKRKIFSLDDFLSGSGPDFLSGSGSAAVEAALKDVSLKFNPQDLNMTKDTHKRFNEGVAQLKDTEGITIGATVAVATPGIGLGPPTVANICGGGYKLALFSVMAVNKSDEKSNVTVRFIGVLSDDKAANDAAEEAFGPPFDTPYTISCSVFPKHLLAQPAIKDVIDEMKSSQRVRQDAPGTDLVREPQRILALTRSRASHPSCDVHFFDTCLGFDDAQGQDQGSSPSSSSSSSSSPTFSNGSLPQQVRESG